MNIQFFFYNECMINHGPSSVAFSGLSQWNSLDKIDVFLHPLSFDVNGKGNFNESYMAVKPDATAYVWSHEIGHVFQLQHTFRYDLELDQNGNCIGFIHECPLGEENYGDYVKDTKGDPFFTWASGCLKTRGVYVDEGNCITKPNISSFHVLRNPGEECLDANGNSASNNWDPPFYNLMSYYACINEFSNGQFERMDNAIVQESHLAQLDMNAVPNPNIQPLDPNIFLQDVVITDHRVLDNEIWELGPGVRLIVEPTGSLTLNNSKILRADMFDVCNDENVLFDRWDGLYYNSNNQLQVLNGSEISGSENGILIDCEGLSSSQDLEILIENSSLKDHQNALIKQESCLKKLGMTILTISNSTLQFSGTLGATPSGNTNSAIELTNALIDAKNNSNLNFLASSSLTPKNFISVYTGEFNITDCNINFQPSGNFFTLFNGTFTPVYHKSLKNWFADNTISMSGGGTVLEINASGISGAQIRNNTITGNVLNAFKTNSLGIYSVEHNIFADGRVELANAHIGKIRNNSLGVIDIGGFSNSVFAECNVLVDPLGAFTVEALLPQQWGSTQISAGNTKTATGQPLAFFDAGAFRYYRANQSSENFLFDGITPNIVNDQAVCGIIGPELNEEEDEFVYNDAVFGLQALETQEQDLLDSLDVLIDGGNTPAVLTAINNTTTVQQKPVLQNLLDGVAPYLSLDAFDLLLVHPLFSWQERTDILLENQALISEVKEDFPTQCQDSLSYTVLDGRQLLEEQIFLNGRLQIEIMASGLYNAANDTEKNYWLSKLPFEFGEYIDFKQEWAKWDFSGMDLILADLALEEELHPMLLQDVQEFQPVLDQLELWKANNVDLYQLDSNQVDTLVGLSDELTLYASAPYAAFMKFFYGVDIQSNVLPQNRSAHDQSFTTYVSNSAEKKIELAPNPGSECFRLINAEGTHQLALYDISGKLVLRGNVGEGEAFCPGASIDAGLYFIQYHNNYHTGTLKWIKE